MNLSEILMTVIGFAVSVAVGQLISISKSVNKIEVTVGIVHTKVENHAEDIKELKSKIA